MERSGWSWCVEVRSVQLWLVEASRGRVERRGLVLSGEIWCGKVWFVVVE
jgi:hypothetical protein